MVWFLLPFPVQNKPESNTFKSIPIPISVMRKHVLWNLKPYTFNIYTFFFHCTHDSLTIQTDRSLTRLTSDKIRKYRTDCNNNPPTSISFMSDIPSTSRRLYSDFMCLLFLQDHRETDHIFLQGTPHLSGIVKCVTLNGSVMRVTIPIDLFTWWHFSSHFTITKVFFNIGIHKYCQFYL
jgi:hypothetical protein